MPRSPLLESDGHLGDLVRHGRIGHVHWVPPCCIDSEKKADEVEHLEVFDPVGILVNGPPGTAGLPFI
jgi:hypothetical protein